MPLDYSFHVPGVQFMVNARKCILGDEMGLGKSKQIIDAADELGSKRILIVTLPASKFNWQRQYKIWRDMDITVVKGTPYRMRKTWDEIVKSKPRVVVTHYENCRVMEKAILKYKPDLIVLDEPHMKIANRNTKMTKTLFKLINTDLKCNLFMATGTPMRNGAHELWPLLHLCNRAQFRSYWTWINEHFKVVEINYGGSFPVKKIGGIKDPVKFQEHLKPYMIRRTADEVFPERDKPLRLVHELEMEGDQRTQYISMMMHNYVELSNGIEIAAFIKLSQMIRLKQIGISLDLLEENGRMRGTRLDWILDYLQVSDKKVVFMTQHAKAVHALQNEMSLAGYKSLTCDYKVPHEERFTRALEFNETPDIRAFISTYKTGGVAIDLTGASEIVLIDKPWVPDDVAQGIKRVDRPPQAHKVIVHEFRVWGSLDFYIERVLEKKQKEINDVLITPDIVMEAFEEFNSSREF